ncbi:hypothetical protein [Ferruginibacter sp.]
MIKEEINTTGKKGRTNFFVKLLLLLVVVFALDYGIGAALKQYYFKQQSGQLYRTTYSMEQTQADVLVFGSSRANHHYDPDVFEKGLNLSYYNVGRDGNYIFYHCAVLKSVLKRYHPKIVVLDFMNSEFTTNKEAYDRISSLLPYYKTHPEIQSIVNLKSRFEKIKLLSSIYPYNSLLFTIAAGNSEFNKQRVSDIKGYVPLKNVSTEPARVRDYETNYEIDSVKVNTYEDFIKACAAANVKLYVVCSPGLQITTTEDHSVAIGKDIARAHQVSFIDFTWDSSFYNNHQLFSDFVHLNDKGARIFSQKLVDSIKLRP